jgi:hypothetical protein
MVYKVSNIHRVPGSEPQECDLFVMETKNTKHAVLRIV